MYNLPEQKYMIIGVISIVILYFLYNMHMKSISKMIKKEMSKPKKNKKIEEMQIMNDDDSYNEPNVNNDGIGLRDIELLEK